MNWDESLFHAMNGLAGKSETLDWVMYEASQEGNLVLPVLLALGYWVWWRWREAVIGAPSLGLLVGFGDFIGGQLKWWIGRPRPCQVLENLNELVGCSRLVLPDPQSPWMPNTCGGSQSPMASPISLMSED